MKWVATFYYLFKGLFTMMDNESYCNFFYQTYFGQIVINIGQNIVHIRQINVHIGQIARVSIVNRLLLYGNLKKS